MLEGHRSSNASITAPAREYGCVREVLPESYTIKLVTSEGSSGGGAGGPG
jgi:hypothetical protein